MRLIAALLAAMVALSCKGEPAELLVDLKTDYVGAVEVTRARVTLRDAAGVEIRTVDAPLTVADLTVGIRLTAFPDVASGAYALGVTVSGPLAIAERTVRMELDGGAVGVTVLITRDCEGVTCPGEDPGLLACLGETCVDPACTPENPGACPVAECAQDSDCSVVAGCARGDCLDGTCVARAEDACEVGQYCDPSVGCVSARVASVLGMGRRANCVIAADGVPYCVGQNDLGQVGDGTMMHRRSPVPVIGLRDVVHLAGGSGGDAGASLGGVGDSFCAVRTDGQVQCWGSNSSGQLGDGTTTDSATPVVVSGLDATRVAVGAAYACAVTRDGAVSCWGRGEEGQLGQGTTDSLVPVPVPGVSAIVAVEAGGAHSCAIDTAGTLFCWGANDRGQADPATAAAISPPTRPDVGSPVLHVSAGPNFTCALRTDGRVRCFGEGGAGQLGHPSGMPGPVVGIDDAVDVAASHRHACAVRRGGEVYCWGENTDGELGDGTLRSSDVPVQAVGLADVIEIDCGGHNTYARTRDAIFAWGFNAAGELSTGTAGNRDVPVRTVGFPGY